ncbi:MAG TPA: histidine triad nucleotide-binding protein [Rhodocyclaceae bacterium]
MSDCIFCRIAQGEIPSRKIYEDKDIFAFHDINPQRPVHFLIIPKQHIASLNEATPENQELLGKMLVKAGELARSQGLTEGFRTLINTGRIGGQEVYHLHIHILGGPEPVGPMVVR